MGLKARIITVAFGGLDEGLLWGDLVSKRESGFKACWGKGGVHIIQLRSMSRDGG